METGIRRFILRLMVGVLTFVIGVGAAMLFTGFRPFERFSNSPYYRHGHCGAYRNWSPSPPSFETAHGSDFTVYPSCPAKARVRLGETLPPPPPLPDAPMPTRPPQTLR